MKKIGKSLMYMLPDDVSNQDVITMGTIRHFGDKSQSAIDYSKNRMTHELRAVS